MEKIKGLIDAPFTPMLANGDINLEPIPAYATMLAENGLKGVFINGSSGRKVDRLGAHQVQGDRARGQLLPAGERETCRPCRRNRGLGYRRHGSSVPEDRPY